MNSSITLRGIAPNRKYIVGFCSPVENVLFVFANGAQIGKFVFSWSQRAGDLTIAVSLRLHSMSSLWSPADTNHWTSVMRSFLSSVCVLAPRDVSELKIFATISAANTVLCVDAPIITRFCSDCLAIVLRNRSFPRAGLTVLLNSAR